MQKQYEETLTPLSADEVAQVAGGVGPHRAAPVQAQDMYGNTMSAEAWMDYLLIPAEHTESGWAHDFYSSGYNSNKSNIWTS